ncbi:MAG: histidine phosphatase family protein [Sodalinema sp.]|uniref:histidine phosphatase family protein n=2 Tax=Cyanophyceae TaxID=3028117 RepID=UPI00396F4D91
MATTVILVRHGQSTYNLEQRMQGRCNKSVLTPAGQDSARLVGRALHQVSLNTLYCSPLARARETAEIVCSEHSSDLQPNPSDLLLEVDLPLWEDLRRDEVKERFADDYRRWKQDPKNFSMEIPTDDGGTRSHFPVRSLRDQAQQFWQFLLSQHSQETVAVVAHNGINRCLISTALGIGAEHYQVIQQSNCNISVLRFAGGLDDIVQLESMNQVGHLGGDPFPDLRPGHQGARILLVRHGETQWNRESRFQGQIDVPLNDNGRAQGQRVAEFLKSLPIGFAVTSPMLRPKETAQLILQHHPHVTLAENEQLREISHGRWEGKLEAEIQAEYGDLLDQWKVTPEAVQMPDGENLDQVWQRAKIAWDAIVQTYADRQETGIVVAHDAVNKAILCNLFGLGPEHFWNFKQGNGCVSVIDYPKGTGGHGVLQTSNVTAHLNDGVFDQTAAGAL